MLTDKLPYAKNIEYDMISVAQRHGCTKGTRETILTGLMSWATEVSSPKIYWLTGMAGTGKTTIAYSFSEMLDQNQMLGATFFCSHLESDSSKTGLIFPTLACQLAWRFPAMSDALVQILHQDPNAGSRLMDQQFTELILKPARAAFTDQAARSSVLVIDALDECTDQNAATKLLSIISRYSKDIQFKFFITSRPEQPIRNRFNQPGFEPHARYILHDVEEYIIHADIELYLQSRFAEIAASRHTEVSADSWPSKEQLETLVKLTDKLFIYAATVCQYVDGGRGVKQRLIAATEASANTLNGKTEILDNLYSHILNAADEIADNEEKWLMKKVLQVVIFVRNPLSVNSISILLSTTKEEVMASLEFLPSVIRIPSSDNNSPISTFHASFPDYIRNFDRSGNKHHLDPSQSHHLLALQCLKLVNSQKENICGISGSATNAEILDSTIKEHISDALAYACIFWPYHVSQCKKDDDGIQEDIHKAMMQFFDCTVLIWIECMGLIGELKSAVEGLRLLETGAKVRFLITYTGTDALLRMPTRQIKSLQSSA